MATATANQERNESVAAAADRRSSPRPAHARPGRTRPEPEPTPEELALRAQAGSSEAFGRLVRHFEDRLFNFLLRRVSAGDAEDLAQETFIRAWQRIDQYDPRWRFSTWLFTIATRLTTSRSRRGRTMLSLEEYASGGEAPDPGRRISRQETSARVWSLVDDVLTQEQRTAVWLRYVEDMAMQDIAVVMGKSQVGVRVMLHRARGTLARHIERGDAEAFGPEILVRLEWAGVSQ